MPDQPTPLEAPDLGRPLTSLPALLTGPEGPESFASHVDRVAAYQVLPASVMALLARAGVTSADRFNKPPNFYGADLSDEQARTFAQVFCLSEPEVRAMLLRSFDGRAFDLTGLDVNDTKSSMAVARREWAGFGGPACCPGCLNETKGWRVRWKLWFSFACLTHGVLLVDRCPRCQRNTGNYQTGTAIKPNYTSLVPKPGFCGNQPAVGAAPKGRAGGPCGQDLGQVETVNLQDAPRLLETQRQIYAVLDAGLATVAGKEVPSLTYFAQLRSLMALVMFIGQPGDLGDLPPDIHEAARLAFQKRDTVRELERGQKRTPYQPYRSPPSDVRLIAAVLPVVCELLAQPDQAAVALALRPFISRVHSTRGTTGVWQLGRKLRFQGVLIGALDDLMAKTAVFDRTVGRLAGELAGQYASFLPDHVPPLLWLDIYRQEFASLLEGSDISEPIARATISMALVKLCGKYSWVWSATALGLDGLLHQASPIRLIWYLRKQGRITLFQKALHKVAAWLSEQEIPTDFRARRKALEHFDVIPADRWEVIASATGLTGRPPVALCRNGAAWVWSQLTGSDHRLSPALSRDPGRTATLRNSYRKFKWDDLPLLEVYLRRLVEEMEAQL